MVLAIAVAVPLVMFFCYYAAYNYDGTSYINKYISNRIVWIRSLWGRAGSRFNPNATITLCPPFVVLHSFFLSFVPSFSLSSCQSVGLTVFESVGRFACLFARSFVSLFAPLAYSCLPPSSRLFVCATIANNDSSQQD